MNLGAAKFKLGRLEQELAAAKRWVSSGASHSVEEIASNVAFLQSRSSQIRSTKLAIAKAKLTSFSDLGDMTILEAELLIDEMRGLASTNLDLGIHLSQMIRGGSLPAGGIQISKYFEEYRRLLEVCSVFQEKLALLDLTIEVNLP